MLEGPDILLVYDLPNCLHTKCPEWPVSHGTYWPGGGYLDRYTTGLDTGHHQAINDLYKRSEMREKH
ncbi:hypothetical protein DPMN_068481 [Dreissena polymorpha]|uniref:Uncharacterized protein n=1 Tax=Dreissena polymorpha TaxID=45954 RepID=A0A9D4BM88_DREPO|nr:hypothetical protein DPMN_068481 [Dreissena polymorpha]